jgi:hypothetical protein
MFDEVTKVAAEIRKWVETTFKTRANFLPSLEGYCAIASYHLWKALKDKGIQSIFVVNAWDTHAFLVYSGYIIDITATQFSDEYPKVMVKKLASVGKDEREWMIGRVALTEEKIQELLVKWPKVQQPAIFLAKKKESDITDNAMKIAGGEGIGNEPPRHSRT